MRQDVEILRSDPGDERMKFRLGETLSKATCITAEEEDVDAALLLERSIFEGLYCRFCYRCGTLNPERARFCQLCGEELERDETDPEWLQKGRPQEVMEMKEGTEMKKETGEETGGSR